VMVEPVGLDRAKELHASMAMTQGEEGRRVLPRAG